MELYLAFSRPMIVSPLFTFQDGTPLAIFVLSKYFCCLVLKGDPVARFKVHDIRKFASSLSLMLLMDVKDLLSAMNWKSPSVFYRHYLTITSRPLQPILLPGGLSAPGLDVDDPAPGTSGVSSSR